MRLCLAIAAILSLCATAGAQVTSRDDAAIRQLSGQLAALSPAVRPREAQRLATAAFETAARLRREYQVGGPAGFHNFLVNAGVKQRGLCHHWARDLMNSLATVKQATFDLHWGIARRGTLREHNSVVVTAKGAPFATGIVLDAWRHSGRLYAGPVANDRYPWKEDLIDCLCAAARLRRDANPRPRITAR